MTALTPAGQLQLRARELAKKILRQGPLAARLAKLALNASARVDLDSGLLIETLAQAICYDSDDKQEGTTAFLEKRKPKFTGSKNRFSARGSLLRITRASSESEP